MATTYRLLDSSGLQPFVACPSCNPAPTFNSYEVQICQDKTGSLYVDETIAFNGNTTILNATSYSVGDVLWAKSSKDGPSFCVEIVGTDVDQEPTLYFNVASGPWNDCTQCINPDYDPT